MYEYSNESITKLVFCEILTNLKVMSGFLRYNMYLFSKIVNSTLLNWISQVKYVSTWRITWIYLKNLSGTGAGGT